jgi:hypothetical protein
MRQLTTEARVRAFMRAIGQVARASGRVYVAGGASAVLIGWRESTIDVDLELDPELEPLLQEIPALKERLEINVEIASPGHFIPELPGWRDRSVFIAREGTVTFYHYDFYAQALSKIERRHVRDDQDLEAMAARGLIEPPRLRAYFAAIEPELYRYPAIDAPTFRRAVEDAVARLGSGGSSRG